MFTAEAPPSVKIPRTGKLVASARRHIRRIPLQPQRRPSVRRMPAPTTRGTQRPRPLKKTSAMRLGASRQPCHQARNAGSQAGATRRGDHSRASATSGARSRRVRRGRGTVAARGCLRRDQEAKQKLQSLLACGRLDGRRLETLLRLPGRRQRHRMPGPPTLHRRIRLRRGDGLRGTRLEIPIACGRGNSRRRGNRPRGGRHRARVRCRQRRLRLGPIAQRFRRP